MYDDSVVSSCYYTPTFTRQCWLTLACMNSSVICPGKHASPPASGGGGASCKAALSLGWEEPLEEGMATYSSILAWRILWTEEPGRLQAMGSHRVRHWVTNTVFIEICDFI